MLVSSLLLTCSSAFANDVPPGKIVVARIQGDAVILYDATSEVAAIVSGNVGDAGALPRLERDALLALGSRSSLFSKASTVTVRVLYDKTGDVSPAYNTPTFAGQERFANLTMTSHDVVTDRDGWKEAASDPKRALPRFVTFEVVGTLPPR